MEEYFRGDTFVFPFAFEDDAGKPIKYEKDDVLEFGIKSSVHSEKYILNKKITVEADVDEITFEFSAEETKDVELGECLMELQITKNGVVDTIYQEEICIKGDVVR